MCWELSCCALCVNEHSVSLNGETHLSCWTMASGNVKILYQPLATNQYDSFYEQDHLRSVRHCKFDIYVPIGMNCYHFDDP